MLSPKKVLKLSLMIYTLLLSFYHFGPIKYPAISLSSVILPLAGYSVLFIGCAIVSESRYIRFSKGNLSRNAENILAFMAVLVISMNIVRYASSGQLFSGIGELVSLRLEKSWSGAEMGESWFTVLGTALGGVVFLNLFYHERMRASYRPRFKLLAFWLFIISGFLSTLAGGRFGLLIHLIFLGVLRISGNDLNRWRKKITLRMRKVRILLPLLFILFSIVSLKIFQLKLEIHDSDLAFAFTQSTGFEIHKEFRNIFGNNASGLIGNVVYYLTHSLYYFDFFLDEFKGDLEFGAYQFYPFVLFTNKLNLTDLRSIEVILYSLPKAGVYFTGFGSMIVDFGYIGSVCLFFAIGLVYSNCYINWVKEGSIIGHYISIIFFLLVLFLPFVGVTGLSVFPSIMTSFAFLLFLRYIP